MTHESLIETRIFCRSHEVEITFIEEMHQYGLIEITRIDEDSYFPADQLPGVEKMLRLYADLGINLEGLDAIRHLLTKIENMQAEIYGLKNELKRLENE